MADKRPKGDSSSLIPIIVGVIIIVGSLAFLFLYDARTNRFTNAPESPFDMIPISIEAPLVRDARLSPEGGSIVFAAGTDSNLDIRVRSIGVDRDVVLADTDSTERHPVWSPDGSRIAFTRSLDGATDIVIVPFRGGVEELVASAAGEIAAIDWANETISFLSRAEPGETWTLTSVRVDTHETREIATSIEGGDQPSLAWSPDGSELVFTREDGGGGADLFALNPVTGDERALTSDHEPIHGVDWSTAGIAFSVGDPSSATIWTISPEGRRGAQLRAEPPVLDPSLSNDGTRVLYRKPDGRLELVVQP